MGNLSSHEEAPFRTLIAAKNSPFSAQYQASPRRPYFNPKFGESSAAISLQKGSCWRHMGRPGFSPNSGKIMDNLSSSEEALFRTLIAAKNAQFSVSHQALVPRPLFLPKIWTIVSRDYLTKKGPFWSHVGCP